MTQANIKKVFRMQGLLIGLIGCGIGGLLGLVLAIAQRDLELVQLSSAFIISAYPISINPWDIVLVMGTTMFLCLAASWYPSLRAAAVEPADAVRNE